MMIYPKKNIAKKSSGYISKNTGEKLPADIEILPSSKAPNLKNDPSGYKGTAVHFQSDENHIDEVYVISQGTENIKDWEYNSNAMLAGQDADQAEATDAFVEDAKNHFKADNTTYTAGLSHSLALNNNATAHLINDGETFDDIYGVNGAQTNYYQLYNNDDDFMEAVDEEFSIDPFDEEAIYDIDEDKLKSFAEDYFKEEGKDIHQTVSKADPLYAVKDIRGFFELGCFCPTPRKGLFQNIASNTKRTL